MEALQLLIAKCSEGHSWFIQNELQLALSHDSTGKDGIYIWALETNGHGQERKNASG